MKKNFVTLIVGILAGIALLLGLAQQAQAESLYTPPQLDQMLAPIALYPDPLIAQILMAATYPLEVVEAARWVQEPDHARLGGAALADALELEDWDPSVKSLVPFPQVLQMMNTQLAWTQQLGDAFLAQQADVMASIQRLRALALAAGNLRATPQEYVGKDGLDTTIVPANPQLVYVPAYNPQTVYGDWPYANYPPDYFGSDWYADNGFGYTVVVVAPLWGWGHCDWRHRRVDVDNHRFNAINQTLERHTHHQPPPTSFWQHDSYHRRGVAYRDNATRERFEPHMGGSPETRRALHGNEHQPVEPMRPTVPMTLQLAPVTLPQPARPVTLPPATRPAGEIVHVAPPSAVIPPQTVVPPRSVERPAVPLPKAPEGHAPFVFERGAPGRETHRESGHSSEHGHESGPSFQQPREQGAAPFGEPRRDTPNRGDRSADRYPEESGHH